jgi:hypothetical protein
VLPEAFLTAFNREMERFGEIYKSLLCSALSAILLFGEVLRPPSSALFTSLRWHRPASDVMSYIKTVSFFFETKYLFVPYVFGLNPEPILLTPHSCPSAL